MRRHLIYYVGGESARFTPADWQRLADALPHFLTWEVEQTGPVYGPCGRYAAQPVSPFCLSRIDGKYLRNDERGALYHFFSGVMAALGITPTHQQRG